MNDNYCAVDVHGYGFAVDDDGGGGGNCDV